MYDLDFDLDMNPASFAYDDWKLQASPSYGEDENGI
jgi:hypothetical protein